MLAYGVLCEQCWFTAICPNMSALLVVSCAILVSIKLITTVRDSYQQCRTLHAYERNYPSWGNSIRYTRWMPMALGYGSPERKSRVDSHSMSYEKYGTIGLPPIIAMWFPIGIVHVHFVRFAVVITLGQKSLWACACRHESRNTCRCSPDVVLDPRHCAIHINTFNLRVIWSTQTHCVSSHLISDDI
jgi:hypothetical protein